MMTHPSFIIDSSLPPELVRSLAGGKAANLSAMETLEVTTSPWFAISWQAFDRFIKENRLEELLEKVSIADVSAFKSLSEQIENNFLQAKLTQDILMQLKEALETKGFASTFVAVRSSGLDEDSPDHSFAGQFSSFLYRKGMESIEEAIKSCWASAYSERGLTYRKHHGLSLRNLCVGVVIQKMVNSEVAGVSFSRNPMDPTDREHLVIDAVLGQGEGLVSGLLDADHAMVHRKTFVATQTLANKTHALRQADEGGLIQVEVPHQQHQLPALSDSRLQEVAKLSLELEKKLGSPQDCEWAFESGTLYCLQTRPITTLPPDSFFDAKINGDKIILWDNANIIESYCGITSPLTFSFAQSTYCQVYRQFCHVIGLPQKVIDEHEPAFRNMLALVRGRIFYNLFNWYKLLQLLPGSSDNASFMETMMGLRSGLKDELAQALKDSKGTHTFSFRAKLKLWTLSLYRFITLDRLVNQFMAHFNGIFETAKRCDFKSLSLPELNTYYQNLEERVLKRWKVPIINDCFCMVFFGLLKKLTQKWIKPETLAQSLPNDLLCGQGDLASAEPTKALMRLAEKIDQDGAIREWLIHTEPSEVWKALLQGTFPWVKQELDHYLDLFGFRCINELKLEEPTLYDNPSFVIDTLSSYVRLKNYSVEQMHAREEAILKKAEGIVLTQIKGIKRSFFNWILKHARKAISHRENLRFARTKIFGIIRELFRAVGHHLHAMKLIESASDVFYLTVDEIFAFIEGRSCTLHIDQLIALRKKEYAEFHHTPAPADRLMARGSACPAMLFPCVLSAYDLTRSELPVSDDPSKLFGVPCSPGVVQGLVRVVHTMSDAAGLKGEILVAERTDPGWVPLYPSSSGLLIERGSLLSHSAVVARELGLPTIVGISGGLMKKLKTGDRVRMDGSSGEIQILGS